LQSFDYWHSMELDDLQSDGKISQPVQKLFVLIISAFTYKTE